jgi:hypothetical protein
MLPLQVGLVPYWDGVVDIVELQRVAEALKIQLKEHFEPIWKIPATVTFFLSLEALPVGHIPLVIVPTGTLFAREHAFHITEKGQPVGLIEKTDKWSLSASHELLEMVCDPQGKRKVPGASIADSLKTEIVAAAKQFWPQGKVEYLLEICDPCQDSMYIIEGVEVSDFVTPEYYTPAGTPDERYSFTRAVSSPLEVLNGGYITWYTSIPEAPIWQATKDARSGKLTVGPLTAPATAFSRYDVDLMNDTWGGKAPATKRSGNRYADELKADVVSILKNVYETKVSVDDLLALLKKLASDSAYWTTFKSAAQSSQLQALIGFNVTYPSGEIPTQAQFQAVHDAVKAVSNQSGVSGFSDKLATIAMLGTT